MKKIQNTTVEFIFGHFVSKYKSKIRYVVRRFQDQKWSNIDFDGIIKAIQNNTGSRYYNITSDSLVNSPTVKKMPNINDKYKTVATKQDTDLFHYIISFLENPYLLVPFPEPSFKTTSSQLRCSSGKIYLPRDIPRRIYSPTKHEDIYVIDSSDDEFYPTDYYTDSNTEIPTKPLRRANTEPILETIDNKKPAKRKNIPSKVRQMTWRKYIGSSMDGKCWCCGDRITFEKWHAGHVVPASKGGPDTVINLRPLCQGCNLSMSNKHMGNFIRHHDMKGKGALEFRADD